MRSPSGFTSHPPTSRRETLCCTAYESHNHAARNSFVSAFGPALDPSWPYDGLWHMRIDFFIEIRKGSLQYRTPASPCCPLCSFNRIMFAAVHIFEEKNIVRNQLGIVVNYARGLYPTRYTHSHNELHANTQLTTDSGFSWIQFLLVTSSPRTPPTSGGASFYQSITDQFFQN